MAGGDFDYDAHGAGYASRRRADPRIEQAVHDALGASRTVVNVGAGTGSYEPSDRFVVAVEPSARMRAERAPHRAPVVASFAETLPFRDASFDAAMAMVTVHQWSDVGAGLAEMRRVGRDRVVVLTFDPDAFDTFWLDEYAPELTAVERRRMPAIAEVQALLGPTASVVDVPIPADCSDGFGEAFFGRPERMLDPAVRRAQSAWGFVDDAVEVRFAERLAADLESGAWDERHGHLRELPAYLGSLRIIVG